MTQSILLLSADKVGLFNITDKLLQRADGILLNDIYPYFLIRVKIAVNTPKFEIISDLLMK